MSAAIAAKAEIPRASTAERKTRVFISYSRKDSIFSNRLVDALNARGFEAYLDKKDILPGEPWKERLEALILSADAVGVVISPDSIASQVCAWEVERTEELQKKLLPLMHRSVADANLPRRLARLNYIFLREEDDFDAGLTTFAVAIETDIAWIRQHTRIGELAQRWDGAGRPAVGGRLLRGEELTDAEIWLLTSHKAAPDPTEVQRAYVQASRVLARSQTRRMRGLLGALAFGVVAVVGWLNQSYVLEFSYWLTTVWPWELTSEAERTLKPKDSFRECARNCPEMIVVSAGEFMMGSPATEMSRDKNEDPQHKVTFDSPFAVSKFEVTFEQWDACVAVGGCIATSDSGFGRGKQPVINVSWEDAQQYVAWFSKMTGRTYRLLSEAEWEYASRAGSKTAYPWGDAIGKGNANCDGCGGELHGRRPVPVGTFAANAFGLHDMNGNVWEWCEDGWHQDYQSAPQDGSVWQGGDLSRRVLRGGSWNGDPQVLRSSKRDWDVPSSRNYNFGFRVARMLLPPTHLELK
jgi:formylglycine-generating enzyme required for sulfatase activity